MSKTPLYKMLQDVPSSGGWTLATLLDGSVSGSGPRTQLSAASCFCRRVNRYGRQARLTLCAEICPD